MHVFELPAKSHSNDYMRMRSANWNNRHRHPLPSCQPSTYVADDAGAITAMAVSAPLPAWIFTGFVKLKQTPQGVNVVPSGPFVASIINIGFTLLLLRRTSMYARIADFCGSHHNATSSPSEFTFCALIFAVLLTTPFPQM